MCSLVLRDQVRREHIALFAPDRVGVSVTAFGHNQKFAIVSLTTFLWDDYVVDDSVDFEFVRVNFVPPVVGAFEG